MSSKNFQEILNKMGLQEWKALWKPGCSSSKRGECLPENKYILVYDVDQKKAEETLLHEALEIKIRGVTQPYRTLVNALLTWADNQAYIEKEKAIDSLLPLLSQFGKDKPTSDLPPKGDEKHE
jgi:hypothetical protein